MQSLKALKNFSQDDFDKEEKIWLDKFIEIFSTKKFSEAVHSRPDDNLL
jgi:hypothetical protein